MSHHPQCPPCRRTKCVARNAFHSDGAQPCRRRVPQWQPSTSQQARFGKLHLLTQMLMRGAASGTEGGVGNVGPTPPGGNSQSAGPVPLTMDTQSKIKVPPPSQNIYYDPQITSKAHPGADWKKGRATYPDFCIAISTRREHRVASCGLRPSLPHPPLRWAFLLPCA